MKREESGKMTAIRVYNVLISTQHEPDVTNETIA